ncbi:hypothetical protein [Streptomyces luteireticuli]|uniref:hypothetical protein n=1 Tax=Streptomyces luteireticuli TaxID=173858 RepID=UPI00355895CD
MGGRRGVAVVLGSMVLVGSAAVWAPAGQAGGREGVTCTGSDSTAYEPGLSLVPRETRIDVRARYACTVGPGRTVHAVAELHGVSPGASCLTVNSPRGHEVVHYADGWRSVLVYDAGTALRVAGVNAVELTGRVVEGRGAGQLARRTVVLLPEQSPTDCLTPDGVRHVGGGTQLEIGPA